MTHLGVLRTALCTVAVVVLATRAEAGAPATVDPFLCYKAQPARTDICAAGSPADAGERCESEAECGGVADETSLCVPNKPPRDLSVSISDPYQTGAFFILPGGSLCNPAEVDTVGATDAETHLLGYKLRPARAGCGAESPANALRPCVDETDCGGTIGATTFCVELPKAARRTGLPIEDRFGSLLLDTVKLDRLLVPSSQSLESPPLAPDAGEHQVDHYSCYKVRVSKKTPKLARGQSVPAGDEFAQPVRYDILKPGRLCLAADKNGEGVHRPDAHLMCYKVRRSRAVCAADAPVNAGGACRRDEDCGGDRADDTLCGEQPAHLVVAGIFTSNQFGPGILDTKKDEELCFPASLSDPQLDLDHDGYTSFGGDCDDTDAGVHPDADELCNGIDDDCNEGIDENDTCPNRAPEITSTPVTSVTESQGYAYDVNAEDADAGDTLTYSLDFAPDGMSIDPVTGLIDWDPAPGQVGRFGVIARAVDQKGAADLDPFIISVVEIDPNDAPTLGEIDDITTKPGAPLVISMVAGDADAADVLTFSLSEAPAGMTVGAGDGLIQWLPTLADLGAHQVVARVDDGEGLSAQDDFVVIVTANAAPVAYDDSGYVLRAGEVLTVDAPGVLGNDTDADGDALTAALVEDVGDGTLDLQADGSFTFTSDAPAVGNLDPAAAFHATSRPLKTNPLVIDMDQDGISEVLYHVQSASPMVFEAIRGDTIATASPVMVMTAAAPDLNQTSNIAAGNIDDDPFPEILAVRLTGLTVVAYENDGSLKWISDQIPADVGAFRDGTPVIADLDADGTPEIVIGHSKGGAGKISGVSVFDNTGARLWTATQTLTGEGSIPQYSAHVADIDLDGSPDILWGGAAYTADGALKWTAQGAVVTAGHAIGNLDDDPYAEIVINTSTGFRIHEHDGSLKGTVATANSGRSTIADFDNDGRAEIGVVNGTQYRVYEVDGSLKWQHVGTRAGVAESVGTVFDLDNDGDNEVIVVEGTSGGGTLVGEIVILDGATGTELHRQAGLALHSGYAPVVADIDADGAAEIVVGSSGLFAVFGIAIFESVDDNWGPARPIWNQVTYHATNVNTDGSIPAVEQPHWLVPGNNSYFCNVPLPEEREGATATFRYQAGDGALVSEAATVTIDVLPPNNAPVILSKAPRFASPDFEYSYLVRAVDPDAGETLTFAIDPAPAGMSIDAATGLITWTPTAGDLGSHGATIKVTDSQLETAYQAISIRVVDPVAVPDVTGMAEAAAADALDAGSLTLGSVVGASSATVPIGNVIAQSPGAATVVAAGSLVNLTVSTGPAPVIVPTLTGLSRIVAEDKLGDADLLLGTVTTTFDTSPRGVVLSQSPAAGASSISGSPVDLVVSVGREVVIDVATQVMSAGSSLPFNVTVFDSNGDALVPQPAVDVSLQIDADEVSGTQPTIDAQTVTSGADTSGAFTLTAVVTGTGASASLDIAVMADDEVLAPFRDVSAALLSMTATVTDLEHALAINDGDAAQSALDALRDIRSGIDLDLLKRSSAFAPEDGFLPHLDDVTGAGFPETAADTAFVALSEEIIEALRDAETLLASVRPTSPFDDDARLAAANAALAALADQLGTAAPTLHGSVLAASHLNHIVSVRVPALMVAQIDTIERLLVDGMVLGLRARRGHPRFFSFSSVMLSAGIRGDLMNRLYMPFLSNLVKSGALLTANALLRTLGSPQSIDAVITGATLSINVFKIPGSMIEGRGFGGNFAEENDVLLIGPAAIDAVAGILGSINGSDVKNAKQLQKKFEAARDAANAAAGAFDQANSTPGSMSGGCLFTRALDCSQLIWPDGFDSVYPSGFGAFPGPVLIVVRNVTTGGWSLGVVNFLPQD